MYRVYFDTNNKSEEGGYLLCLERSRKDLLCFQQELRDGLMVTLYMPNELEMTARLYFSDSESFWRAEGLEETVVFLGHDFLRREKPGHSHA